MLTDVEDLQLEHLIRTRIAGPTPSAAPTFSLATDWITDSSPATGYFSAANGGWGPNNNNQVVASRMSLTLSNNSSVDNASTLQRQIIAIVSLRNRETP
jgi:hypothetical protein